MSCLKQEGNIVNTSDKTTHNFSYIIPNFDQFCTKTTDHFDRRKSPAFTAGEFNSRPLRWQVYIQCVKGKISCHLTLLDSGLTQKNDDKNTETGQSHPNVHCAFRFGLASANNPFHFFIRRELGEPTIFSRANHTWANPEFISVSDLHSKKEVLLPDHHLTLSLQMRINCDAISVSSPLPWKNYEVPIHKKIVEDYGALFASRKFSDVQVKCGDVIFHCHRCILAARSQVFAVMLDTDMEESVKKEIIIEDLKPSILAQLLNYIYASKVELDPSSSSSPLATQETDDGWTDLIYAAEKYDLPQLKNAAFDKLFDQATDQNIGQIAVTAYTFNADPEFREAVKTYCQNNLVRLMGDSSFRKLFLTHPTAFYDDDGEDKKEEKLEQENGNDCSGQNSVTSNRSRMTMMKNGEKLPKSANEENGTTGHVLQNI